jgi:hypothetical protein
MRVNLLRGFNRSFVVLTALWVVYCLFVYPMQQGHHAQSVYESEFRDCFGRDGQPFKECTQYAELKSGVDMWTLRAYYSRESWFLALIVVTVPLLAYGLCRGLLAVAGWVWRGFQS